MASEHGDRMKKALVVVIAVLAIVSVVGPLIKRRMLPAYATPESIEALFPQQLAALKEVAEGKKNSDEIVGLFADPAIHGAVAVTFYGENGWGGTSIKEWDRPTIGSTLWWPAEPTLDRAVVNIWEGRFAVFEKKFRTESGDVKGCQLVVDVSFLERQARRTR